MAHDANALAYASLGDLRLAAVLHRELLLLLGDRSSGMLDHPAMWYLGSESNRGSTVIEIPLAGLDGYDEMGAVAENADAAVTAMTDASPNLTIARQALRRQVTDLAQMTESLGIQWASRLAQDMVGAARMRLVDMVANITDDFTATVGTSGADMTVDDWFDATFALTQGSVPGPYMSDLYPVQLTDLQSSIRAEGGALQFMPASADMLGIKGPGYAGSFLGVDIFASSKIPTASAGADSAGGMFGRGAVAYADCAAATAMSQGAESVYPAGTRSFVGFDKDLPGAYTDVARDYYAGAAIAETGRGVSIITDR